MGVKTEVQCPIPEREEVASQWLRTSKRIRQGRETTEGTNHVAKSSHPPHVEHVEHVGRESRHITNQKVSVHQTTDAHTCFTEDVPFP